MITFLSVTSFRNRLASLLKVKKGVYSGVIQELCNAFEGLDIEQIRQNRDMILSADEQTVIKLRLPDKKQHLSKSDGYRLIYIVFKNAPVVALLDIYPKRGPKQQLDIDDKAVARLVNELLTELTDGTIQQHEMTPENF